MTLSRNATAFSIDALLSRQDSFKSDQTNLEVGSAALKSVSSGSSGPSTSKPYPILDAAFSKPLQHDNSGVCLPDKTQEAISPVRTTLPLDFASSFASIENRLRQISVQSPELPQTFSGKGEAADRNSSSPRPGLSSSSNGGMTKSAKKYQSEHQLTIPSFKIHVDNMNENVPLDGSSPESIQNTTLDRRYSAHSTTSTEKAEIEEALMCLKHNAVGRITDKPLAVDQWVRSTLEFTTSHEITLVNSDLWKKFNRCGTEMILNRAGRRMFPSMLVTVNGLEESVVYRIRLHIAPADGQRYKFINCQWLPVGKADGETACTYFEHHDSPNTGAFWMKGNVSFSKLKITNNKENVERNIVLNSMHKYIPRIVIIREVSPVSDVTQPQVTYFSFPETAFIAVTAYQNQQITQLKIQNNPFAKAFRDADVAALLQSSHGLSPDMAYSDGYQHHSYISRRGSSPDYRPYKKLVSANETSDRRRSLPGTTPYLKPNNAFLRPPSGFANMPWYSKLEKPCRLPRESDHGGSACSSLLSLESGFGDSPIPTEMSEKVRLTKSKSTEVYSGKQEKRQQHQSFGASGGCGSASNLSVTNDVYWTHSPNPRIELPPSHSLSSLPLRSPPMSKRRLEPPNCIAFNLNIPLKRCRSISPSRMTSSPTDMPTDQ
ncbi:uncharacterized protein [Amphiura filiformis]|uniref:uncharacterized protein n=1 Tax=Amphiura filiformis TaxID=82378 RepID=UPI003B224D39